MDTNLLTRKMIAKANFDDPGHGLRSEAPALERTVLEALPPVLPKFVGKVSKPQQAEPAMHGITRRSPVTRRWLDCALFLCGWLVSVSAPLHRTGLAYGADAVDTITIAVALPTTTGEPIELQTTSPLKLRIICILGCECPLAKLYAERLNQLAAEFGSADVQFIGINSNPQDSLDEVTQFAADHQTRFPLAKDHDAMVLTSFGATRTPEVIAIDSLGSVVYRGRIDDQYRPGIAQTQPKRNDLREAIADYLAGRPISVSRTDAAGCLIAMSRTVDPKCIVTYCGDVAAIFARYCIECHRPGEIGPFSLTRYDDVTGWADMILEVIDQKRMPPWHASSDHASLINERRMSHDVSARCFSAGVG